MTATQLKHLDPLPPSFVLCQIRSVIIRHFSFQTLKYVNFFSNIFYFGVLHSATFLSGFLCNSLHHSLHPYSKRWGPLTVPGLEPTTFAKPLESSTKIFKFYCLIQLQQGTRFKEMCFLCKPNCGFFNTKLFYLIGSVSMKFRNLSCYQLFQINPPFCASEEGTQPVQQLSEERCNFFP